MTKLTRLKINKFRNVEPVELKFSNGLNVLLGINGSGKTTFLELIAAILRQDVSIFREDIFDLEYELSIGDGMIRVHLDNQIVRRDNADDTVHRTGTRRAKSDYALRVRVTLDIPAFPFVYTVAANRISITATSQDRSGTEGPTYSGDSPSAFEERFLDCAVDAITNMGPPWADFSVQSMNDIDWFRCLSRFDESLKFYDSIVRVTDESGNDAWIAAHTDHSQAPFDLLFDYDVPVAESLIGALDEAANSSLAIWRGSETINLPDTALPFLREMTKLANFKNGRLELRLVEKNVENNEHLEVTNLDFGMLRFWFEKLDGSIIPDQKLSYGQKRLLSFLYYLDCNPTIVIADELAAGLHHAWISACLEAIGDRQAFLASHDPILIDEIDLGSIEDVERSFLLCRCDTSSGKERLSWSNMSRHDAERFFEAYNVGLQHVSEILRTQRLW